MGSRARSLGVSDCFPSVLVQHLCSQDPRHLARPVHDPRGLSAPRGDWLPEGCSEQHAGRSESGETSLPWAEVGKARQLAGWGPGRRLRGCEGYSGRRAGSRPCSWRPHRVEACCWRFRSPRLCPVLAGSSFPLLCSLLGHGLSGLGQEMVPGLRRKRGSQGSAGMVWGTPPREMPAEVAGDARRGSLSMPPFWLDAFRHRLLPGAQRLQAFSFCLSLVHKRQSTADVTPPPPGLPLGVSGARAGCSVGKQQMPAQSLCPLVLGGLVHLDASSAPKQGLPLTLLPAASQSPTLVLPLWPRAFQALPQGLCMTVSCLEYPFSGRSACPHLPAWPPCPATLWNGSLSVSLGQLSLLIMRDLFSGLLSLFPQIGLIRGSRCGA